MSLRWIAKVTKRQRWWLSVMQLLHDGCKLIKIGIKNVEFCNYELCWSKSMQLQKDLTPDFVHIMSHWQLAKLLSSTIDIGQKHRVIEYFLKVGHNHSQLRKHKWLIRMEDKWNKKQWHKKKSNVLLWTLIQCNINPYKHCLILPGDLFPWVFIAKTYYIGPSSCALCLRKYFGSNHFVVKGYSTSFGGYRL